MKTTKQEWEHIAVYNSGKADMLLTLLAHFENKMDKELLQYINVERELALKQQKEAEGKL